MADHEVPTLGDLVADVIAARAVLLRARTDYLEGGDGELGEIARCVELVDAAEDRLALALRLLGADA